MEQITLKEFLGIGISLFTFIGMVANLFYNNWKNAHLQDEITKKNEAQDKQLTKMWEWKDHHEIDASEQRRKFEVQMAEIRGELKGIKDSHENQFNAIMERLTRVENKIDRLEQRVQG